MDNETLIYLVVENATDVCEGIERRMNAFNNWHTPGYCTGVKEAVAKINHHKPALLFLDWGLNGGSAYEVLHAVQNISGYNPYIIFNTGFQKDNPEIPQEIMNNYKVDKYLVKPYWENLRQHLPQYLKEAAEKAGLQHIIRQIWVEDIEGVKRLINLSNLCCIVQHATEQRARSFYFVNTAPVNIYMQWQRCCVLLNENSIDYFIAKSRSHLVIKGFVQKFEKPYLWVKGVDSFKLDVVKENIKEFEKWLMA